MKITTHLCAIVASVAIASSAAAADLPLKARTAQPVFAPNLSWTGFYIGINVGAGWGTQEGVTTLSNGNVYQQSSYTTNGFMFGGQAGYNWQLAGPVVIGIEGSIAGADISGTSMCLLRTGSGTPQTTCNSEINWVGDISGRVGFTVDRALVYVKGGYAWADTDQNLRLTNTTANGGSTRSGWLLGTGVEYAFMSNWSAKVEYNYIDFGSETLSVVNSGSGSTYTRDLNQTLHTVKFGVNYRL